MDSTTDVASLAPEAQKVWVESRVSDLMRGHERMAAEIVQLNMAVSTREKRIETLMQALNVTTKALSDAADILAAEAEEEWQTAVHQIVVDGWKIGNTALKNGQNTP